MKRRKLEKAFNLIKTHVIGARVYKTSVYKRPEPPCFRLTFDNFSKLMKNIYPKKNDIEIKILFTVLDFTTDDCLSIDIYFILTDKV